MKDEWKLVNTKAIRERWFLPPIEGVDPPTIVALYRDLRFALDSYDELAQQNYDLSNQVADLNQAFALIPLTDVKKYVGELERKLKIAEDAFINIIGDWQSNAKDAYAEIAIKQIRGE